MKKIAIWLIPAILILPTMVVMAQSPEGADSRPGLFNPQTVETVSGIVVSTAPPGAAKVPQPVHLSLKTDRETITVILGPAWFIEQQGLIVSPLDKIQVTGSRVMFQGKPSLIAAEVKKGDRTLRLRDEKGAPVWGRP
jgi:hypothetical protein